MYLYYSTGTEIATFSLPGNVDKVILLLFMTVDKDFERILETSLTNLICNLFISAVLLRFRDFNSFLTLSEVKKDIRRQIVPEQNLELFSSLILKIIR